MNKDTQDEELRKPGYLKSILYDNAVEYIRHALTFVPPAQWDRLLEEARRPETPMRIVK